MKNFQKWMVVPFIPEECNTSVKDNIDKDLTSILVDKSLAPDEKVKVYNQKFHKNPDQTTNVLTTTATSTTAPVVIPKEEPDQSLNKTFASENEMYEDDYLNPQTSLLKSVVRDVVKNELKYFSINKSEPKKISKQTRKALKQLGVTTPNMPSIVKRADKESKVQTRRHLFDTSILDDSFMESKINEQFNQSGKRSRINWIYYK